MRIFLVFTLLLFIATAAAADLLKQIGLGEQDKPPLLRAKEAFELSAGVKDSDILVAQVAITEGYYLYRDKFAFQVLDAPDTRVVKVVLPPGKVKKDPFMGVTEVYPGEVNIPIAIKLSRHSTAAETITLKASFQGCSAIHGICYPPVIQKVTLELPPLEGGQVSTVEVEPNPFSGEGATIPLAPQDKIVQTLFNSHIGFITAYDDQDKAMLQQFSLYGLPAVLFFGPDGEEIKKARLIGYASPEEFLKRLQRVDALLPQQGAGT